MIRKLALSSPLLAAAAVENRGDGKKDDKGYLHTYQGSAKRDADVKPLIYRPSELPLYKPVNADKYEYFIDFSLRREMIKFLMRFVASVIMQIKKGNRLLLLLPLRKDSGQSESPSKV